MTEFQILDTTVVSAVKNLRDNIKNDIDQFNSMEQIAELVYDHKLIGKNAYKTLLQSVCDLLREKGYTQTADFFVKHWQL